MSYSPYDYPPPPRQSAPVSASGTAQPLYSAAGQTLAAGSVYSLFVLGDAAAPTGVLRRDR